jgi:hypothetical protein
MQNFLRLKVPFLNWFLLMLSVAVGLFYAWKVGFLGPMIVVDHTHITWLIAGVVLLTSIWIGLLTWRLEDQTVDHIHLHSLWHQAYVTAFLIFLGISGSTLGFWMQATSLTTGTASLQAFGTGILPTFCAALGSAFIILQSFNLHMGVDMLRAAQGRAK